MVTVYIDSVPEYIGFPVRYVFIAWRIGIECPLLHAVADFFEASPSGKMILKTKKKMIILIPQVIKVTKML